MTEIERKALALVNEVGVYHYPSLGSASMSDLRKALLRAVSRIEELEATERDDKGKAFDRIEQGLSEATMHSKGMRDERAAIVAWLRKQDGHGYDDMRADLIEAGEHHERG